MKSETTYSAILGRILAQERKKAGMDQAKIAGKTGINRSTWSRMENGEVTPDALQLNKIANALGTTPEKFITEANDAQKHLERKKISVRMVNERPDKSSNKVGAFLIGAALGALITALATAKDSSETPPEDE